MLVYYMKYGPKCTSAVPASAPFSAYISITNVWYSHALTSWIHCLWQVNYSGVSEYTYSWKVVLYGLATKLDVNATHILTIQQRQYNAGRENKLDPITFGWHGEQKIKLELGWIFLSLAHISQYWAIVKSGINTANFILRISAPNSCKYWRYI